MQKNYEIRNGTSGVDEYYPHRQELNEYPDRIRTSSIWGSLNEGQFTAQKTYRSTSIATTLGFAINASLVVGIENETSLSSCIPCFGNMTGIPPWLYSQGVPARDERAT